MYGRYLRWLHSRRPNNEPLPIFNSLSVSAVIVYALILSFWLMTVGLLSLVVKVLGWLALIGLVVWLGVRLYSDIRK